jgi:integrase
LAARGNGKARRYPLATVEALQDRFCRGIGVSTSNGYLAALKGFTRWLWRKQKAGPDPLAGADRLNADADVRHERRALPEEELRSVLAAAAGNAAVFEGLTGRDRHMLYAVAMVTGFRASEVASLAPRNFALDADPPTATVRAAYTKNGHKAIQPLPPDVAQALRAYLAGRPEGAPLWPGDWPDEGAEMLRLDLAAADIPYRDAEGRVADFHALRHSYVTLLERSGVSPKVAQELARHSDIRLTMNVYTHTRLCDLAGAVKSLPALLSAGPEVLSATGTEGAGGRESLRPACASPDAGREKLRTIETATARGTAGEQGSEVLSLQTVERVRERLRLPETKLPGQDSNLDKENQNL